MASKIDCVAEVLRKRMDAVDQSKNLVEADKMQRLPNKVWILVELHYDQTREARKLLETGFEYVCQKDDITLFRKRK